jgi:RNA polymerase sigma-70 factor, ECF subfamily
MWSEKEFEELFRTLYTPVCRKIVQVVKDPAVTEDLVQNVFVKLWEKREDINITSSASSYVYRAAMNAAFNHLRQSHPFIELEPGEAEASQKWDTHSLLEHEEAESQLKNLTDALPPACRAIFILSREEGYSYKEISDTLNISIKTVENQMTKALKILRARVAEYLSIIIIFLSIF